MTKQLRFISDGRPDDPIVGLASDFLAVWALNGHLPDDEEIREELRQENLDDTTENLNRVRELLNEKVKGS